MISLNVLLLVVLLKGNQASADSNLQRLNSWFYKPTAHPTTLEDSDSPYHYSYYSNNNQHQHDYYSYGWSDRAHDDKMINTYSPTSTPTFNNKVPTYMPTQTLQDTRQPKLSVPPSTAPVPPSQSNHASVVVHEHFLDGFGVFVEEESPNTHHYPSVLGRQGVVELKKSSTLSSYDIAIDIDASQQLTVGFSFHTDCMKTSEGFCLEYSVNDDLEWNPVRCWQSSVDFENNLWHDNFIAILDLNDNRIQVDSLRIRFETVARGDDSTIKFDRISLVQH